MTSIGWINQQFVVIDAWQSLEFASGILDAFRGLWIVVSRRHEGGMKWYLLTRLEFETKTAGQPKNVRVEGALGLREHLASEVFYGRGRKQSTRQVRALALNSANRVVLLDSATGIVRAIGTLQPEAAITPSRGGRIKLMRPFARKAPGKKAAAKKDVPRRAAGGYGGGSGEQRPVRASAGASRPVSSAANEAYTLVPVYFGTDRLGKWPSNWLPRDRWR